MDDTGTSPAVGQKPEQRPPLIRRGGEPERTRAEQLTVAERLAGVHFSAQHEAARGLDDVEITRLDPLLRGLLFTDGTVSRALEAHTLFRVAVEALEQAPSPAPAGIAGYLQVEPGHECLRRRVLMKIAGMHPSVWAESYLVASRLPRQFLAQLDGNAQGIGGSLQQLKLESRRELLWFGLGAPPRWGAASTPATTTLTRVYRVLTEGLPALLICEAFAVELYSGRYHLRAPADPEPRPTNGSVGGHVWAEQLAAERPAGAGGIPPSS